MITNKVLSKRKCKEFNLKREDIFDKKSLLRGKIIILLILLLFIILYTRIRKNKCTYVKK